MPVSKKLKPQPHWLNQKQMAAACGLAPRNFAEWGVRSVATIGAQRFYLVGDVLSNRMERLRSDLESKMERQETEDLDIQRERTRETKERADNLALKNAQLRRELCPVSVLSAVLSRLGAQISAALETIPAEVRRKVPALKATELEVIKRVIVRTQNSVAEAPVYLDDMLDDIARAESNT